MIELLKPPTSFMGGKQRLSKQIVEIISSHKENEEIFYDFYCGSGAVSVEMINQKVILPENIVMVDYEKMMRKNNYFRNYWKPTETSQRRSPVQTMMPNKNTLYSRTANIVYLLGGKIRSYHKNIMELSIENSVNKVLIYIDPPYQNTTGYKNDLDIYTLISKYDKNNKVFVSEGFTLDNSKRALY